MGQGGYREGAGRKPLSERLTNYNKFYGILDDNIENIIRVLLDGLEDPNKSHRLKCAQILLNKAFPDVKVSDIGINTESGNVKFEVVIKDA